MSPTPKLPRLLIALVLVLGGAGGLVLWIGSGPDEPLPGPPRIQEPPANGSGRGTGLFIQDELDRGDPLDLTLSCEVLERLPRALGDGPATLAVRSTAFGRPTPVELVFVGGPHAGERRKVSGPTTLIGLASGAHLCRLVAADGRMTWRLVRLGQDREGILAVDWSHPGRLRGVVFDDHGEPIHGAEVRLGEHEARTGADGRFGLEDVVAGGDQPLCIAAEGRASKVGLVSVAPSSEEPREFRFQLDPGVDRRVLVQLPPAEQRFVRGQVLPCASRTSVPEDFPFAWIGHTTELVPASDGTITLRGLPRDRPLCFGLVHPRYRLEAPVALGNERTGAGEEPVFVAPQPVAVEAVVRSRERATGNWGLALLEKGSGPALPALARSMGGEPARRFVPEQRVGLRLDFGPPEETQAGLRALRLRLVRDGIERGDPRIVDPRDGYVLEFESPVRVRLVLTGLDGPIVEREVLVDSTRSLTLAP